MSLLLPRVLSLGLCLSLVSLTSVAFSASKAPVQKSKAGTQKSEKAASAKLLNPAVPYTFSSDKRQVMIPQTLANLLASQPERSPDEMDFMRAVPLESMDTRNHLLCLKRSKLLMK